MTNEPSPQEALAEIAAARASLGQELNYPFAYDLAYGGMLALMVGGAGLQTPWSTITLLVSLAALALMVNWWRKHTGWWVNGFSPPRARWVTVGLMVVVMALMGLSFWPRFGDGPVWVALVAGGLAGLAGIIGGRLWMAVYRQELKDTAR
ncbi:MAG TPA: hypothetical protein PLE81_08580 [Brevundimonas sp.]|uniref:hypothetical protein n=1 Tax=Brevundimonas sp. TaxID=1871086 RepID=UPI002D05B814|nr:hypothetical protein [Brevundimonas sp.]HRH20678.1 hypothetical protein [Brevundimonas sp.]